MIALCRCGRKISRFFYLHKKILSNILVLIDYSLLFGHLSSMDIHPPKARYQMYNVQEQATLFIDLPNCILISLDIFNRVNYHSLHSGVNIPVGGYYLQIMPEKREKNLEIAQHE
jgi:hypothetical protein